MVQHLSSLLHFTYLNVRFKWKWVNLILHIHVIICVCANLINYLNYFGQCGWNFLLNFTTSRTICRKVTSEDKLIIELTTYSQIRTNNFIFSLTYINVKNTFLQPQQSPWEKEKKEISSAHSNPGPFALSTLTYFSCTRRRLSLKDLSRELCELNLNTKTQRVVQHY